MTTIVAKIQRADYGGDRAALRRLNDAGHVQEKEVFDAKVQRHGDVALLTFNLVSYGTLPDRPEGVLARWNSTEAYSRVDGKWKIIHSHWSHVKPELKQPGF